MELVRDRNNARYLKGAFLLRELHYQQKAVKMLLGSPGSFNAAEAPGKDRFPWNCASEHHCGSTLDWSKASGQKCSWLSSLPQAPPEQSMAYKGCSIELSTKPCCV